MTRDARPWRQFGSAISHRRSKNVRTGPSLLRPLQPLDSYPRVLTERLEHWARVDRTCSLARFSAWRAGAERATFSYGEALRESRALGQALLNRGLSADRPLAILSGNGLQHLLLALAAQHVGVPFAPISPAYSLVSHDFGALKHVIALLSPGLVFVSDLGKFGGRSRRPWARCRSRPDRVAVDVCWPRACSADLEVARAARRYRARRHREDPLHVWVNRIAQRRHQYASNALQQSADDPADATVPRDTPPVLVDWLPWHHTFGGNHNIGLVVYNGGSLYLDEGRPTARRIRRKREEPARSRADDLPQRAQRLRRARAGVSGRPRAVDPFLFDACRCCFMPPPVCRSQCPMSSDRPRSSLRRTARPRHRSRRHRNCADGHLPALAERGVVGHRPSCAGRRSQADAGGEKLEMRVRGPNVTPGYWRQDALTRDAFDDEGLLLHGRCRATDRCARHSGRASFSTDESRKTSSSRPARGSASGRCAPESSPISRPTSAMR